MSGLILATTLENLHAILWRCVEENVLYWPADDSLYTPFPLKGCTNKLNILTTVLSAHTVFMYFVFAWEQTATCDFYIKKGFFNNRDEKCLQRGTVWTFKLSSLALCLLTFWLRDAPTSLTFNNCTFSPHCIYVFCNQRLMPLTA
jgi:hypothetical protein